MKGKNVQYTVVWRVKKVFIHNGKKPKTTAAGYIMF